MFPGWSEYGEDEWCLWRGPPSYEPLLVVKARTWLLSEGWKEGRHDLVPRGAVAQAVIDRDPSDESPTGVKRTSDSQKSRERISIFEERACKPRAVSGGLMSWCVETDAGLARRHGPATWSPPGCAAAILRPCATGVLSLQGTLPWRTVGTWRRSGAVRVSDATVDPLVPRRSVRIGSAITAPSSSRR
jgi:hypothetical protein